MKLLTISRLLAALSTAFFGFAAGAADNVATAAASSAAVGRAASDAARPAIGHRVGGSPADAEFRAAMQSSGDAYRQARTGCRAKAGEERSSCMNAAKATLRTARAEAKTKHDEAVRAARAAKK